MSEGFKHKGAVLACGALVLSAAFAAAGLGMRANSGIPHFNERIALNAFGNDAFLEFLRANEGRAVAIDSLVDLSPATDEQIEVLNACNAAYPATPGDEELLDGFVYNRRIVLPVPENLTPDGGCVGGVALEIRHPQPQADLSHGGTGIVTFGLRGVFKVSSRALPGPETRYVLDYVPPRQPGRLASAPEVPVASDAGEVADQTP